MDLEIVILSEVSQAEKEKYHICLVTPLCPILCDLMDCSPPCSLCPWDSPGKNTGVGHALLKGIFPT